VAESASSDSAVKPPFFWLTINWPLAVLMLILKLSKINIWFIRCLAIGPVNLLYLVGQKFEVAQALTLMFNKKDTKK
jgi:hypothetical protein